MSERPWIFVINDPHAMRINRDLADEIGFQESVVFLQLEYLIVHTKDPSRIAYRDSRWWYRATLKELNEEQFSWWSEATISRVLHRLEERSLISTDETNAAEYDRTQWYAIDEEGVRNLASIAIFHSETAEFQNETPVFQNETTPFQNETTIQGELVGELKESLPNGRPKKVETASSSTAPPDVSSPPGSSDPEPPEEKKSSASEASGPRRRVSALTDDEAESEFTNLCKRSKHGDALGTLAELLAEENATGKVVVTKVWRELGMRYLENRKRYQDISEEAWAYGFEQAISKPAPNIGYVTAAARGYKPQRVSGKRRERGVPVRLRSAVVGTKDSDYEGDPFARGRSGCTE